MARVSLSFLQITMIMKYANRKFLLSFLLSILSLFTTAAAAKNMFGVETAFLVDPSEKVVAVLTELQKTSDFAKAAQTVVTLHNDDDVNATYVLGVWHELGLGVQRDLGKAMGFYKAAADKGHAAAMNNYGFNLAASSQGDTKKTAEGVGLVRKAMEAGNPLAARNYAVFTLNGIGMKQKNPAGARKILEDGIKAADAEAALVLSGLYAEDNGIGPDQAKVVDYLNQAASLGSANGQQALGQLYLAGTNGVEKNVAKALELLTKSSNGDNAVAKNLLATMYEQGLGVKKDPAKALEFYLASAKLGNGLAQNRLGNIYQNGEGVAQDLNKALGYFRAAAAQGLGAAIFNVGVYYEDGRTVDKDPAKAFQYFLNAGAKGLSLAQHKAGLYYMNGVGTHRDTVAGRAWFDLAAKQGFAPAQTQLALLYEKGLGIQRNLRTAAQLFSLASDQGDVGASLKLATYYANGVGVEADPVRAYVLAGKVAGASDQATALAAQLKEKLTPAQVADGNKQLAELKAKASAPAAE